MPIGDSSDSSDDGNSDAKKKKKKKETKRKKKKKDSDEDDDSDDDNASDLSFIDQDLNGSPDADFVPDAMELDNGDPDFGEEMKETVDEKEAEKEDAQEKESAEDDNKIKNEKKKKLMNKEDEEKEEKKKKKLKTKEIDEKPKKKEEKTKKSEEKAKKPEKTEKEEEKQEVIEEKTEELKEYSEDDLMNLLSQPTALKKQKDTFPSLFKGKAFILDSSISEDKKFVPSNSQNSQQILENSAPNLKKLLEQFIYLFHGEVVDTVDEQDALDPSTVVHIVCDFETNLSLKRLKSQYSRIRNKVIVEWKWILECAKKQKLINIEEFTC